MPFLAIHSCFDVIRVFTNACHILPGAIIDIKLAANEEHQVELHSVMVGAYHRGLSCLAQIPQASSGSLHPWAATALSNPNFRKSFLLTRGVLRVTAQTPANAHDPIKPIA